MDFAREFFLTNFILIFIAIVMFVSSIIRYKQHPRVSVYTILIMICALALSVFLSFEKYGKFMIDPQFTLIFAVLGYTVRPTCVYLFFLLIHDSKKSKLFFLTIIPLIIVYVVYFLAFSPTIGEYIVSFEIVDVDGTRELSFQGGYFRYTSHIVALLYMLAAVYISFTTVKFKRIYRALTVITCVVLIVTSVVIESFVDVSGKISILNTAIGFCVLIYYLYLSIENAEIDSLTGLYNGEVYNKKIDQLNEVAHGVILFKIILDNDESLNYEKNSAIIKNVAKEILRIINRKMLVYRIEETKFLLVDNGNRRETLISTFEKLKTIFISKEYKVNMGYAYRSNGVKYLNDLINESERMIKFTTTTSRNTTYIQKPII